MSETMAEPDWLAAEPTDRAKLTAIIAALRRCYAECGGHGHAPGSPHITTTMAELFIGQIMITADERIRASERERIAADERVVILERPEPRDILVIGPHGDEQVSVTLAGDCESPGVFLGADPIRLFGDEPLRVALALVDTMRQAESLREQA